MTVVEFTGGTLPAGWTAVEPAGSSVDLPGDYVQLTIDPGQSFNSLSSSVDAPEGPLVQRSVSGAFDLAVGLAEEATVMPTSGIDLLALNSGAPDGVRLGLYTGAQTSSYDNDTGWFIRSTDPAITPLNTTGDAPMGGLYGCPGWLRLAWDGVDTYTCYASHTGRSGDWHQLAQFTSGFTPDLFAIHAVSFPSGSDGRVQRIQRVVDLAARGSDDATDTPDVGTAATLHSTDFSAGSLPAWLTPSTANGGAVTTTTAGAELTIDESQTGSRAWLVGPTDLPADHGLLVQYQLTAAGYLNAFWVPAVAVATTTDVPGAEVLSDKWGNGTGLIMEMPAREHASQGQLLRLLRRSPIPAGADQTGSREFDGYSLMIEDDAAPVGTVGLPLTWLRMEHAGHEVRVRLWLDGDPEPATWTYRAQGHMRGGLGMALTLAHNDSVSGSGTASVRFSQIELYDLSVVEESPLLPAPPAQTLTVPAEPRQLAVSAEPRTMTVAGEVRRVDVPA